MRNFFSSLFGMSNEETSNAQPTVAASQPIEPVAQSAVSESYPSEIQEGSAASGSKPEYNPGVVTINLRTGRPIDAIYWYIKNDNEQLGYTDAIRLHNIEAMEEGVNRIKNGLKTLFDQVNTKYQERVLKQETIVKTFRMLAYSVSESEAQSVLDQLKLHIQEVERFRKDLESNADNVRNMTDTYKKGFKQGMLDIMGGGIHKVAPTSASSSENAIIEG